MKKLHLAAVAGLGLVALCATPVLAATFSGFTTANVNQRSGPSTAYPAITVIPAGSPITIYGCLSDDSWCDISWGPNRGWMSSAYLQVSYQSHRYPVRGYTGIPFITFNFGNYWNSYYQHKPFFSQKSKWDNYWQQNQNHNPPPPKYTGKPPKYTGNPPNFTGGQNDNNPPNGGKPPKYSDKYKKFDKGSGSGSGYGSGSGNGSGTGSGSGTGTGSGSSGKNYSHDQNFSHGKPPGKNCKWINGKWVCT
ncbi:MAG TPA: SH3 domain-containing protein [Bauldia sp.]|nr:SH3 domain-containing protein [Bauldia sp.]